MANVRKILHPTGKVAWRATIKALNGKRKSKNHATKREAVNQLLSQPIHASYPLIWSFPTA